MSRQTAREPKKAGRGSTRDGGPGGAGPRPAGAPDPKAGTELIAACMEGLFLHRLGRHAELDARGVIERVVRAALA